MRPFFLLILSICVEVGISLPERQSISGPTGDYEGGDNLIPKTVDAGAKEGRSVTEPLSDDAIENLGSVDGEPGSGSVPQTDGGTTLAASPTDCSSDAVDKTVKKRKRMGCELAQAAPPAQAVPPAAPPAQQNPTEDSGVPSSQPPNQNTDTDRDAKYRAARKMELSPLPGSSGKGPVKGILCPVWRVPLTQPLCCAHKPLPLGVMVFGCTLCMSSLSLSSCSFLEPNE